MSNFLVADDHPLIIEGVTKMLLEEPGWRVCCTAANTNEILAALERHPHDLLIMDITMPGRSGIDLLSDLKDSYPKLPVLILSMHPEDRFAIRSIKAGASGYLSKDSISHELIKAVRKVLSGGKYVSGTLAEQLANMVGRVSEAAPHDALSNRELEILRMIASGKKLKEIAEDLAISINTVKTYRARVLEKLNIENDVQLTQYAIHNRLVE
jgi:DNA-binding NarL/FixJ family response regulator